jgi:hypothetical protein
MSKTVYEVSTVVGTYQKDGRTKNRYQIIGAVIESKNGLMLKIDNIPLVEGGWNGWAYMNEPRPQKPKYEGLPADEDESIPF